jgi:hypothetical protein
MKHTVLGLALDTDLPDSDDYRVMPYAAITVVKAIDTDGDEVQAVLMTQNLSVFEGAGLMNFGKIYIEEELRKTINVANRPPEKK